MLGCNSLLHPAQLAHTAIYAPAGGRSASIVETLRCLLSFWHRQQGYYHPFPALWDPFAVSVHFFREKLPQHKTVGAVAPRWRIWIDSKEQMASLTSIVPPALPVHLGKHSTGFPGIQQPAWHASCPDTTSPMARVHGPVSHSSASIPSLPMGWRTDLCLLSAFPRTSGSFYGPVLQVTR